MDGFGLWHETLEDVAASSSSWTDALLGLDGSYYISGIEHSFGSGRIQCWCFSSLPLLFPCFTEA